jgi:flagellar L-ring protein precursor FlgH
MSAVRAGVPGSAMGVRPLKWGCPPARAPRSTRRALLAGLLGGVILTGAPGLATWVAAQEPGPSIWNEEQGSRYSNRKARHVGDLITVLVTESSMGSNRSSLKTKKQSKFNAAGGPGSGPLKFLPSFGAKTDVKDEMDGGGSTVIQGELNTKITAQVLEIRPNGHLVVEGSRLITVNSDEDRIILHGVVRPEDIAADNTVLSTFLAEAVISYNGKGPVRGSAKRGVFQRIVSWFF